MGDLGPSRKFETREPAELWTFDLSTVTERLHRKGVHNANALELGFRKMMLLWHLHPAQPLTPSKALDDYWHELILDTKRYRQFCEVVFGSFLDHIPDDAGTDMDAQFKFTKALYRDHFGTPEMGLWMEAGTSMGSHTLSSRKNTCDVPEHVA